MRESYSHQHTFIPIFPASFQDPYFKQSIVKKDYQTSLLPTTSATSRLTSLTDRPLPFSLPDRRIFPFLPDRSHPHPPYSLSLPYDLSPLVPFFTSSYLFFSTLTVYGPCLSLTTSVFYCLASNINSKGDGSQSSVPFLTYNAL